MRGEGNNEKSREDKWVLREWNEVTGVGER